MTTVEIIVDVVCTGLFAGAFVLRVTAAKIEERAIKHLREATDAYALARHEREEAYRVFELTAGLIGIQKVEGVQ